MSRRTSRRPRFGSVSHMHEAGGGAGSVREDIQALDYDIDESTLFHQELLRQPLEYRRRLNLYRWLICGAVGCGTGVLAFAIDCICEQLFDVKFSVAAHAMTHALRGSGSSAAAWVAGLATMSAINLLFVSVAVGLVVCVSPVAGGSGIPEVKAYLQGVKVPRMLRFDALLAKSVGVLCAVASGLVVGKEGPMIHIGAIIAAGVSQGSSKSLNVRTMWLKSFRNDHDKRDFVSAGAAAGVAAAFGAPIGGTLFAMEEAATYWSQPLTWRTFFCALCSTFTLNILLSSRRTDHFGALSHPGLITFGAFLPSDSDWDLRELPIFVGLGVVGGLVGAAFVSLSRRLTVWRLRAVVTARRRVCEVLAVTLLTTFFAFSLPLLLPCADHFATRNSTSHSEAPWRPEAPFEAPNPLVPALDELLCPAGRHAGLGEITLGPHEHAIKVLFHSTTKPAPVNLGISAIYALFSFALGVLTYGLPVPSGLFVPAIMAGGATGRLFGELLSIYAPGYSTSPPGNFALIGAAAVLGGVCRMTISITVIVVECTTNISYLLPIALTIMVAKLVGDLFNEGIYDMHIRLKRYPMLPEEPPHERERLQAKHVMATSIKSVCDVERVGKIIDLLNTTTHHGFPVIASSQLQRARPADGNQGTPFQRKPRVLGIVLREQLVTILAKLKAHNWRAPSPGPDPHALAADDFLRPWFNEAVSADSVRMSADELERRIDLRPYINEAAVVTAQNSSLRRVSALFRSLGLRHLLVVESCPTIVGVVTRKDLL
mmetsp:Transcript_47555/g.157617  ORF Transcript_47555/g.157617 Transcript_47555/m.157617 type:complete len:770 (-) Transcript_47555:29-2338(-)